MFHSIPAGTAAAIIALLSVSVPALAATPADTATAPRTIQVAGHGEVQAAPDEAQLSMAVRVTDLNLQKAQKQTDAAVKDYVAKARALGVAAKDLATAGYSVQPQYDYGKEGRTFRGYQVTRNIHVTVRDLARVGDYLQAATDTGVNEVSAVQLQSSQAAKYRLQALAQAAQAAREQARTLATALDMKLGTARLISNTPGAARPPQPVMMRAMAASAPATESANDAMGFSAGMIEYAAEVRVDFDVSP